MNEGLSQSLAERIAIGVEAHFRWRRHALMEEVASESARCAMDALLDSHAFQEVIFGVI